MNQEKSVSGTKALPRYESRKDAADFRGQVERAVAAAWAKENVRIPMINRGAVPVDMLCTKVRGPGGKEQFDANTMMAINSTIQWLFGTNCGRTVAEKLLAIEDTLAERERLSRRTAAHATLQGLRE